MVVLQDGRHVALRQEKQASACEHIFVPASSFSTTKMAATTTTMTTTTAAAAAAAAEHLPNILQ